MSVADLTQPAPSLLPEKAEVLQNIAQTRVTQKGDGKEHITADTPFWRIKRPKRKPKCPIVWGGLVAGKRSSADQAVGEGEQAGATKHGGEDTLMDLGRVSDRGRRASEEKSSASSATASSSSGPTNNPLSFSKELDLVREERTRASHAAPDKAPGTSCKERSQLPDPQRPLPHKGSPQRGVLDVLTMRQNDDASGCTTPDGTEDVGEAENNQEIGSAGSTGRASSCGKNPTASCSSTAGAQEQAPAPPGRESDAGRLLIQQLRETAVQYEKTGIDPDLLDSLGAAVKGSFSAGLEKVEKNRALRNFADDFSTLVAENRATTENLQTLMRSLVVQNRVVEAYALHDQIKAYGFSVDANMNMFTSLILSVLQEDGLGPALPNPVAVVDQACGEEEAEAQHGAAQGAAGPLSRAASLSENQPTEQPSPPVESDALQLPLKAARARALYLHMRNDLISPTSKVFGALMHVHCACNELEMAEAWLHKMEEEWPDLGPNLVHWTILIDGMVKQGQIAKAFEKFQSLRTWQNLQPDEVLFTVMIKACGCNEEAERALNLLDDLRTSGLYPTDITYRELIHVLAKRPDFAAKAFQYKQHLEAEDFPVPVEVYEDLLLAASHLQNSKLRANHVLAEMLKKDLTLTPKCYEHLLKVFARAMYVEVPGARTSSARSKRQVSLTQQKLEQGALAPILLPAQRSAMSSGPTSAQRHHLEPRLLPLKERMLNLRQAWMIVQQAKERKVEMSTALLDAVLTVYVSGGFDGYAIDMLHEYSAFGAQPKFDTYRILLEMFHVKKDVARFFSLWDLAMEHEVCADYLASTVPHHDSTTTATMTSEDQRGPPGVLTCCSPGVPELAREKVSSMYHLALENSVLTQSSRRCCSVLKQMHAQHVFPSPALSGRLAKVGRHVLEIHEWVQKFIDLNKTVVFERVERDRLVLDAEMSEYKLREARDGRRAGQATAAQSARKDNFKTLAYKGLLSRPRLEKGEYLKRKAKGGEYWAARIDRGEPARELPM
ncbi:unnamed protein product [Amoebophrya sp. A120]|nr:unnamed protein product [Amoebophrya sp. A120]|eukprot:GSA120T00005014001.1